MKGNILWIGALLSPVAFVVGGMLGFSIGHEGSLNPSWLMPPIAGLTAVIALSNYLKSTRRDTMNFTIGLIDDCEKAYRKHVDIISQKVVEIDSAAGDGEQVDMNTLKIEMECAANDVLNSMERLCYNLLNNNASEHLVDQILGAALPLRIYSFRSEIILSKCLNDKIEDRSGQNLLKREYTEPLSDMMTWLREREPEMYEEIMFEASFAVKNSEGLSGEQIIKGRPFPVKISNALAKHRLAMRDL